MIPTGILIIHDHKVASTTFFKCEVGAGAIDSRRLPSPLKVDLRVYGGFLDLHFLIRFKFKGVYLRGCSIVSARFAAEY